MDYKLQKLKKEFNESIPTRFTERDKRKIFNKIHPEKNETSEGIFPKTIAVFTLLATSLAFIFTFGHSDIKIIPSLKNHSTLNVISNNDDNQEASMENTEGAELEDYKTEITQKDFRIFNAHLIAVGDSYGKFTVTNISEEEGEKIISFKSENPVNVYGDIIFDGEWLFTFNENKHTLTEIPFETNDVNTLLLFKLRNEEEITAYYTQFKEEQVFPNENIGIDKIDYVIGKEESYIILDLHDLGADIEMHTNSLRIDQDTVNLYEQYRVSYDDQLLSDIEAFDVFSLYLHSSVEGDEETANHLLALDEDQLASEIPDLVHSSERFLTLIDRQSFRFMFDEDTSIDILLKKDKDDIWRIYLYKRGENTE